VRDNGVGMSVELLTSAFDLFRQGSQGLERSQGGLGVGLTLVQRLITLHGGAVQAHSEGPGRGSEFVVRLPIREEPAIVREATPASRRPADPVSSPGPARRILIVDDNRDAAQALCILLEADGHEVRVASDGASGLDMARAYRPEVVLLDIGLPKMDGYEIAKRIRSDPAMEGTVLVAVTGYGQMHDRARASASGFHHHLVKPVEFTALQEVLRAQP
jgi:two-component system CheB/CheR fusion protein